MQHIARSIDRLFKSDRFAEGVAGWRAVERWSQAVGEEISSRARAVRFERGVLYVEVTNSSWVQELSFLKRRIVQQLNREIGRDAVRDIRFSLVGGGGPRRRREP